jgi:hypothetical protein
MIGGSFHRRARTRKDPRSFRLLEEKQTVR